MGEICLSVSGETFEPFRLAALVTWTAQPRKAPWALLRATFRWRAVQGTHWRASRCLMISALFWL